MNSVFQHARFQAPLATMRSGVSNIWRKAYAIVGRYKPIKEADRKITLCGDVDFSGDIPVRAGGAHKQTRLCFSAAPPLFEVVENLVVTPAGAGWKDGVLYEQYSASKPGLRAFLSGAVPKKTIAEAYFVQSEHTDTFGDWTSEYLAPLARIGDIDAPVLLPASIAARSYVKRDAARLGVNFVAVNAPIRIENAKVVRQSKVIRYWMATEVVALRAFLNVEPVEPEPGSIVYLSRFGEASEVAVRSHPNAEIEAVVRAHGGLVLRTAETDLDQYLAAARSAETVIFDHGSAGYNMIYWRPKRVIEIVSDAWWMNAFLFFADAIGNKDYSIIRSDLGGAERVVAKLTDMLALRPDWRRQ